MGVGVIPENGSKYDSVKMTSTLAKNNLKI